MKIGYDKEELKNKIIELYYSHNNSDNLDLNSNATIVEENYLIELKKDISEFLKSDNFINDHRQSAILEVEDLGEDLEDEEIVDIELLNKVEQNVIGLLQYLRLELYDSSKVKDFIVYVMLDEIKLTSINKKTEELLENIIKNMVDHEFKDLDNKKKLRKENLVNETNQFFSNQIEVILEEHKSNNSGKMTEFQIKTLKKFVYKKISNDNFEKFKKENKLNYEELNFVDYIVKKIVDKMVKIYIQENNLLKKKEVSKKEIK